MGKDVEKIIYEKERKSSEDESEQNEPEPEDNFELGLLIVETGVSRLKSNANAFEKKRKPLPYPKSVFFIIINEFCERFSFYGMRTVLSLFLKNVLNFDEDFATVIYHTFVMFVYFTPTLGAALADSFLGKFKTIFYLSIVYAIGLIVLSLAAIPTIPLPVVAFTMIGLGLIALGTGGIKPCVAAFGGDQFVLPQQENQLKTFFSIFYFAINGGSLISTFITPMLRKDIKCFDSDSCYSASFGVPSILFIVAIVIFVLGKPLYKIKEPAGNIFAKVIKCIWHAISVKRKSMARRIHWMDYADDEYDSRFIEDIKILLRILFLYLPLPLFWALFDQQGSRWTFMAARMDGNIGGYIVKPDQVQVLNPLLILACIPIFDKGVYPFLAKFNLLKKPLQRITTGGVLAGLAFAISGVLELQLQKTYPMVLENGESNLNIINSFPCPISIRGGEEGNILRQIRPFDNWISERIKPQIINFTVEAVEASCTKETKSSFQVDFLNNKQTHTLLIGSDNKGNIRSFNPQSKDDLEKSSEGYPKIKIIVNPFLKTTNILGISVELHDKNRKNVYNENILFKGDKNIYFGENYDKKAIEIEPKDYSVNINFKIKGNSSSIPITVIDDYSIQMKLGASYILFISAENLTEEDLIPKNISANLIKITDENKLHMGWLLPQYLVITFGEVMFSVTGLEFSYSQAPVSMKSMLQACWLLTVAFGNLIVVIIAEAHIFAEQWKEFFLFAGLMFLDMGIFGIMAYKYQPANLQDSDSFILYNEDKKTEDQKK